MLNCQNNTITLTRGDTAVLKLDITDDKGNPYKLTDGDVVIFTLKKSVMERDVIFQKSMVDGKIIIQPQDTAGLEYGQYFYDVELTKDDGFVATVIPPHRLVISEEVTW